MQVGIPLEEVFSYVSDKLALGDTLDFELRLAGQGAIKKALTTLRKIAGEGAREGKDFESSDLEAAKALAKFGIDALKIARMAKARDPKGSDQNDLFDVADPWKLKAME